MQTFCKVFMSYFNIHVININNINIIMTPGPGVHISNSGTLCLECPVLKYLKTNVYSMIMTPKSYLLYECRGGMYFCAAKMSDVAARWQTSWRCYLTTQV